MQRVPLDVSRTKLARTKMKRFRFLQRSSPLYSGRMQVKRNRDVKPQSNTSYSDDEHCNRSFSCLAMCGRCASRSGLARRCRTEWSLIGGIIFTGVDGIFLVAEGITVASICVCSPDKPRLSCLSLTVDAAVDRDRDQPGDVSEKELGHLAPFRGRHGCNRAETPSQWFFV